MPEATLLIDNDAFLALAGTGLLDRALQLLDFVPQQCLRLPALPFLIGRSKSIQRNYPADVRLRATLACSLFGKVSDRPVPETVQQLASFRGIDEGESFLYGLLAEHPVYFLASGDKQAMLVLGSQVGLRDIRRRVAGRVISLETVLKKMVEQDGVEAVAQRLSPLLDTHKALQVVFSEANRKDQAQCLHALDSYLNDLIRQVGEDFLYQP